MVRKPTFAEAVTPLVGMLFLLGLGYGKFGLPIQVLLIIAAAVASVIGLRVGLTW